MDFSSVLLEGAFVAADVCLLGLFYKLYKDKVNQLHSLEIVRHLEINSDLPKQVESAGGVIPYAAICGNIKSLATPLRSHHFTHLRGVIYTRLIKERQIRWNPLFSAWGTTEIDVEKEVLNIPFGLAGGTFFKKQIVEVVNPLSAKELSLFDVYDDFKWKKESLSDTVIGYFRGEHTLGTHEVERILPEEIPLTAVGKLAIENGKLKIMPPKDGLTYFLTASTFDTLIDKIRSLAFLYKGFLYLIGAGTVILVVYNFKRIFVAVKQWRDRKKQMKRFEEARRLNASRPKQDNEPSCVVCLENAVEVMILECGHMCLCLNCSEHVNGRCPVCRAEVRRFVPGFLP
ncbi:mitochondrial ubiquitin ligase activator of NFKB 1 [Parasteatoda tepidariorum]|uniref:mitochondrial ubiquitin ligase activator of NFKB 1 n=1 Tax=Parasteatoda tepidariorum TaxID=114398 RepID=UPI00077F856F|nr:mitochondrial ubiquitin ligase activator of NFKB 1 [Parasteatoda tepidariorum]XP_015909964.1 mitochondrial ubiquitin ligase activator of NFKB 1 [Parasteatoda tepidariorum]XP_015909965.1 mitochondrial ubiquitin ligase activator of NFKB 1 [Parasteatoda tepidariorum]